MNHRIGAWLMTACIVLALLFLLGPIQQLSVVSGQSGDPRKTNTNSSTAPAPKKTTPLPKKAPSSPKPTPTNRAPSFRPKNPGIELVRIRAGSFMMGSMNGYADEKPVHRVAISQPFYMGKYEVTQAQWQSVMGNNPSIRKNCDNCPVEQVSWDDAQQFLAKLNDRNDGFHYRLPSEAEWEYACRAGTTGDYAGDLDSMAWYGNNSGNSRLDADTIWRDDPRNYSKRLIDNGNKTHPVGSKQPNAWGLYDMHGNVWEWCQDWYHDNYNGAPTDGSAWLSSGERKIRVLRGGLWAYGAYLSRSAYRVWYAPVYRDVVDHGFRVVAVR